MIEFVSHILYIISIAVSMLLIGFGLGYSAQLDDDKVKRQMD